MTSDGFTDRETGLAFAYDPNGLRTEKSVTANTYQYTDHTVKFVADGRTIKTMTVAHGYVLTGSDYPEIPRKVGYVGAWNTYSEPVTADIVINASYSNKQHTVRFLDRDNLVLHVMTVGHDYVLHDGEYPPVPEAKGYDVAWDKYTEPIRSDVFIWAIYTPLQYTVTFEANGKLLKRMTVDYGYVLTNQDYPSIPLKTGCSSSWDKYTAPITSNITIQAVYTPLQYAVTFVIDDVTVGTRIVDYGYVLTNQDYPPPPTKNGYVGSWNKYTSPIRSDITIHATFTPLQQTVTFVADGVIVGVLIVDKNYVLTEADYPGIPKKEGYRGKSFLRR